MARLIDADRFLRETRFQEGIYPHCGIKREIENQPSVDAQPVVHGRWERYNGWRSGYQVALGYKACCCGGRAERKTPYCPNCGAKMDGGDTA